MAADAILKAAQKPTDHIKISVAKVATIVANLIPALGEKLAAKQGEKQQLERPPVHPEGTLYHPGERGRIYGLNHRSQH